MSFLTGIFVPAFLSRLPKRSCLGLSRHLHCRSHQVQNQYRESLGLWSHSSSEPKRRRFSLPYKICALGVVLLTKKWAVWTRESFFHRPLSFARQSRPWAL